MLNALYSKSFIKDLKFLKNSSSVNKIKHLCFEEIPRKVTNKDIQQLKKIKGFTNYYRIRVGDYRIGIKLSEDEIIFVRILHRKDIYRYFP